MRKKLTVKVKLTPKLKARGLKKGYTRKIKDIGALGKGRPVVPPLRAGAMNKIAKQMGYNRITDVPDTKMKIAARKLIRRYGERRAFGMVNVQAAVFRKRKGVQPKSKRKFLRLRAEIKKIMIKTPGWK